jgi:8-amino-7-oxononanoate synthase
LGGWAVSYKSSRPAEESLQRLFSRVSRMHRGASAVAQLRDVRTAGFSPTDFSTLPGYEELRLQCRLAETAGVEIPYFRLHEGRAGAQTRIGNRDLLNFSSYDYLGLNNEPEVAAAAKHAIDHYGVSASASRHVAGERPIHRTLERTLADHYGVEDCAVFVSGYATNLGVIGQLLGPKDLIVYDAVIHNSALMGAVLSGAARRSFPHNDLDSLDRLLASTRSKFDRTLIVVEGLYSMDGDHPDLRRLIDIKKRYGSWLMVDEAHALGVLGKRGHGSFEHCEIDAREVDIWMGTLSKTLAACGGYIAGSSDLVDYLKCMVGVFVYSVGMPPLIAAAALKSLQILYREQERVERLQHNAALFDTLAKRRGLDTGNSAATAVCPIMVGDSLPAVVLCQKLFQRGINVQPVTYPAVPAKTSRLRFFLTTMHGDSDIEAAVDATAEEMQRMPETMRALNLRGFDDSRAAARTGAEVIAWPGGG